MERGDQLLQTLHLFVHINALSDSNSSCQRDGEWEGKAEMGSRGSKGWERREMWIRDMQTLDRSDKVVDHVHKLWNSDKEAKGISTIKSNCWGNDGKDRWVGHKGGSCVHAKACLGPPRRCSFPSPIEALVLQVRSDLLGFSRHLVKQPHPQWEDHGVGTDQAFHISDTWGTGNRPQYLREFHLHVSKYMEEADHCVPQPAVS